MANTVYNNFFLANEIEDQYDSHLALSQFFSVRNDLEGTAGMKYTIHKYSASDSVAKVAQGAGNSGDSEATYTTEDYDILCAQGRFKWYDEEEKKDPIAIQTGVAHLGVDMFNTVNGDYYTELKKAEIICKVSTLNFDAFADAVAEFELEDDAVINAFISPADVAALRKALATSLQYVEDFARKGYVGTVCGVNIYTKKDAVAGRVFLATPKAVTVFNKTGVEYEGERDANTRMNRSYARKYYVVALTDATQVVEITTTATFTQSSDTSVVSTKTYYSKSGNTYTKVTPASGDNPQTKGWYERS